MSRKYVFLLIFAGFVALLIGCHAGGHAPYINLPEEDTQIVTIEREVGEDGRFADIIFPSGAIIRCTADHTMKKGTKVTVTERKTANNAGSTGDTPAYMYNISAKLFAGDALNTAVSVNTLEKPLSVTLPNDSDTGLCYLGTRTSETDPWRYTLATEGGQANTRFIRLSPAIKTPTFNIYRLGVQFALFVFTNSGNEAEVDYVENTAEKVGIKDGKYADKLIVKMIVEGENLRYLKDENLVARITYRSNNLKGADIDFAYNKTDRDDKAVSGKQEHSFEINNLMQGIFIGNKVDISFVLNLDGISLEDFPTTFLMEFYSESSNENILPFCYTQNFSFETEEKEPPTPIETYTITLELNGGTLDKTTIEYTSETEDFNLPTPTRTGYTFLGWTGYNGDTPEKTVTIFKGSTDNRNYEANWQQNAPDEYTLTLVAGKGIASVDESKAYKAGESITLNCTVKDGYEFDKWVDSNGNEVESPFTMLSEDVILTATAKTITYNLNYFIDGGQLANDNPKTYTVETEDITLCDPTKEGYEFLGWTSSEVTAPLTPMTIKQGTTGDKTFTANWTLKSYSITYNNIDGCNFTTANPSNYTFETEDFTLCDPTKEGYEFLGWTSSETTFPLTPMAIKQGTTGDKTFTANWSPKSYSITYNNIDGCSFESANPSNYTVETEDITLCDPTKEGYEFLGWTSSETTVPLTPMAIKQGTTGDQTFTANWSLKEYSITYNNVSGCTFETANPTTYNIESDEITLSKPTKANDTFTGWTYEGQTSPQLEVKIAKGSTGDKVFNANWEAFAVISLKTAATDFPINGQIQLEFDKNIAWQDSYKANITITPTTTSTSIDFNISYNNKVLTITPADNLKYNTEYTVAVAGIENVCDNNMAFKTVALAVIPQISSKASDISQINGVDRHILQPTFTIVFGKKVLNQTVVKSSIKLNDTALPNSCTLVFDEAGKIATLTFTADLNVFTDYTLSLNEFADDDNATISAQTLSFKTVPPEDITGEGTLSSPYLIYTQAHLNKLREDAYLQTGKYFKQMDNIVMTGNWTPIGSNSNKFYGFYDGNNLKITGLTIQTNNNYAGLFSAIGSDNKSKIENLKLENVNINGAEYVGALAGYINKADITNVHVIGEVNIESSGQIVGGLTGECDKTQITRCSVDSPNGLINVGNSGSNIGGLIGLAYNGAENNSISESYASITVQGNSNVGGLVGYMYKYSIVNSYSDSSLIVIGNNPTSIGGLIGETYDSCSFNNCYAKVAYGSGSVSYGNCLVGYIQEDAQHPFGGDSKNNFAWRAELPIGSTKILYKFGDGISPEDGKDSTRNNYFSNGYPSSDLTGANWVAWNSEVWDTQTPGSWPKLKWQSGN